MPRARAKVARVCKVCGAGYMSYPWGSVTCSPKCAKRKTQDNYCLEATMTAGQSAAYIDLAMQAENAPAYLRSEIRKKMAVIAKAAKPMRGGYTK